MLWRFCIHIIMYTKPHIYHVSFDIKGTKNSEEYNAIWNAIDTVFETYRDNGCYIDILDSSCLIFSSETEKEIMNKLKDTITNEGVATKNFWCFISSVDKQSEIFCFTKEMRAIFNEWTKTDFGFNI